MTSTLDYALMAGNAYQDTRNNLNRIPYPAGCMAIRGTGRLLRDRSQTVKCRSPRFPPTDHPLRLRPESIAPAGESFRLRGGTKVR